jgi:superfamily II DNA or RNA helicase
MSIKLSSIIGYKTLCIVPNSILEDQWVDEISNFTGLSKDKIGIIQGSDIAKIEKNNILDNDIIVVKIQTLLSQLKRINLIELEEFYSRIGLVFYDECHQSGAAESYAKTAIIFKTDNIIGLSATPFVKGINDFLMTN